MIPMCSRTSELCRWVTTLCRHDDESMHAIVTQIHFANTQIQFADMQLHDKKHACNYDRPQIELALMSTAAIQLPTQ